MVVRMYGDGGPASGSVATITSGSFSPGVQGACPAAQFRLGSRVVPSVTEPLHAGHRGLENGDVPCRPPGSRLAVLPGAVPSRPRHHRLEIGEPSCWGF